MTPRRQSIALVTPSLEQGGMERVLSEVINYACKERYKVFLICLVTKDNMAYDIDRQATIIAPPFSYKKSWIYKIKVLIFLVKTLKAIRVDAVLSFSEIFNPISVIAGKVAGTPTFISDRSSPTRRHGLFKSLMRGFTYPWATGMIAQTEAAKRTAIKKGFNKNICVIPNPLKTIKDYNHLAKQKAVISVGRLIETKNFESLIRVFCQINRRDWELWILGDGPQRLKLQNLINSMAFEKNIKLFGRVADVDHYLAQSSIFAFTSISEGFPNALSEAMAFPLPCVAYDCPAGPADIIQSGVNGFLVPLNDEKAFKEKLTLLIEDKTLREEFKAEAVKIRKKYSKETIIQKYLQFIFDEGRS